MQPIILGLLPVLILVSSVVMYRFSGKREIFKMDMTQFLYTFILGPVAYVWMKSFLFFLLRNELNLALTIGEYLRIDTLFSVLFLFLYAFVVIHSLTKSFHLATEKDDVYDFFAKSEYFHMDFSHYGIFLGIILLGLLLGLANLFFPFPSQVIAKTSFYGVLIFSALVGLLAQTGLYYYRSNNTHFLRLMKFFLGLGFMILAMGYIILEPNFNSLYLVYWSLLSTTVSMVAVSLFSEQKEDDGKLIPFRLNFSKMKFFKNIISSL